MRIQIGFAVCVLAAVLFAANPIAVPADEARSYEQLSPNGKYLFVMLTKGPDKAGHVDTLKTRYSHSGLYKAADPKKSLWRVNWYSSRVHISSDGIHLVRIGRTHSASMNGKPDMAQLAISFYTKGVIVKKYVIGDLIADPARLVKAGAGFQWQKRIAFDDASGTIEVTLITGNKRVFGVKSGALIPVKAAAHKDRKKSL